MANFNDLLKHKDKSLLFCTPPGLYVNKFLMLYKNKKNEISDIVIVLKVRKYLERVTKRKLIQGTLRMNQPIRKA
jgi:hypothetical protein